MFCLVALTSQVSTLSFSGTGPMPSTPFSEWNTTSRPAGMKSGMSVGRPRPRLTYQPSGMSRARRAAISWRPQGFIASVLALTVTAGPRCSCLCRRRIGALHLDHAVHEDAWRHHAFRIELAQFYHMAHLRDGELGGHRHHRVEIAPRASIGEIAPAVGAPRLDQGDIGMQRAFHDIGPPVELAGLL